VTVLAVGVVTGMVAAASDAWAESSAAHGAGAYASVDTAMRRRVRDDALSGGALLVVRDRVVLHRKVFGDFRGSTVVPIASASKWLTAATVMTLVDEGRLGLDDPVSRYLPGFHGAKATITVRQLLSHTSGLASAPCESDRATTLANCVDAIANGPDPTSPPGSEFHYSGVGFQIAGRIVELLTGQRFERAFEARIADPLHMTRTRFDGMDTPHTHNPAPAASAVSTVDDYGRFLDLLVHRGMLGDARVLTAGSVAEIERDQVPGIDTHRDAAVQITSIPTYGLGVWRDVTGPVDEILVVSGSGALGFYPWIDRRHSTYGVVGVVDRVHGAAHAVPLSARIARQSWTAAASQA
jgi:CubicO group peptidase (beta-lactamase class C family)